MNKVILSGRLTKDPNVSYDKEGKAIARFTLACNRRVKDEADFISCVAFGKTAEFVEKWFKKGSGIALDGRIQTGSYTNKEGQKVYTTDVICDNVEFNGSKKDGEAKESEQDNGFINVPESIDSELPFA